MKLTVASPSTTSKELPVIAIDFDGTVVQQIPGSKYLPADQLVILPAMEAYIKRLMTHGDDELGPVEIWIFTARMAYPDEKAKIADALIRKFCREKFGKEFFVTALKTPRIARIVDDKACRVDHNTGVVCPGCKAAYGIK